VHPHRLLGQRWQDLIKIAPIQIVYGWSIPGPPIRGAIGGTREVRILIPRIILRVGLS
jgi:hypothetical protein